jgi:hypothetical protein
MRDPNRQLESFLNLGRGLGVEVTAENRSILVSVASELDHFELYAALHDEFSKDLSVSTFCEDFGDLRSSDYFSDRAVGHVASHFHCMHALSFVSCLPW